MPKTEAELARKSLQPMFRVRMSLRKLGEAGMVAELDRVYQITEEGAAHLKT